MGKISLNHVSEKELISRIYKELLQRMITAHWIKKPNSPIVKWVKNLNRNVSKEIDKGPKST